jgi:hypothetical protein
MDETCCLITNFCTEQSLRSILLVAFCSSCAAHGSEIVAHILYQAVYRLEMF